MTSEEKHKLKSIEKKLGAIEKTLGAIEHRLGAIENETKFGLQYIRWILYIIMILVGTFIIPMILKAFGIELLWDPFKWF
jgi:hypothetical protein